MRFGVGTSTVLNIYHPDGQAFYNNCNDLQKLCIELADPLIRHENLSISLFLPFSPMKCRKSHPAYQSVNLIQLNHRDVPKLMNNEPFWIEEKLDGNRVIMHMKKNEFEQGNNLEQKFKCEFRYFTRYSL